MKIIFLDIDGVMATSQCWGRGNDNKWDAYMFDPKCVAVLNSILIETGAEIILSSDWKHHYSLTEMRDIFTHNGVIKGPIGFTPSSKTYTAMNLEGGRIDEIHEWLKMHNTKNDLTWVSIDDLSMFDLEFFVHCPRVMEGIKQTGVKEKILKILNK